MSKCKSPASSQEVRRSLGASQRISFIGGQHQSRYSSSTYLGSLGPRIINSHGSHSARGSMMRISSKQNNDGGDDLMRAPCTHLKATEDLLSRLITPVGHVVFLVIHFSNLLTKSPEPPQARPVRRVPKRYSCLRNIPWVRVMPFLKVQKQECNPTLSAH